MKIKLNEKYYIETDNLNITLYEVKIKTEKSKDVGGDYNKVIGYYSSFKNLANRLVEKEILESNVNSFLEIHKLIENTAKSIDVKIQKEIKGEC